MRRKSSPARFITLETQMAKIATNPPHETRTATAVTTHKQPQTRRMVASAVDAAAAPRPDGPAEIGSEERRQMIAAAAYYRAERRGFTGGSAEQDWLLAEAEIDRALGRPGT